MLLESFRYGATIGDDDISFTQAGLGEVTAGIAAEDLDVENLTVNFQIRRVQRRFFIHVIPRQTHLITYCRAGLQETDQLQ